MTKPDSNAEAINGASDEPGLAYRELGSSDSPAIILLHGLFGDGGNLLSLGKVLAESHRVFLLDLRNHGDSPHFSTMGWKEMAEDVSRFMISQELDRVDLFGHSLGGKVAMQFALMFPGKLKRLIVEDIAPVEYPAHHAEILRALVSIDLSRLGSRQDADVQLARSVGEQGLRSFLLKNLKSRRFQDGSKQWYWRCNLPALQENYNYLRSSLDFAIDETINDSSATQTGNQFQGSVLFIKGEKSDYLTEEHRQIILSLFPRAALKVIQEAGHWAHSEKPLALQHLVLSFLAEEGSEK